MSVYMGMVPDFKDDSGNWVQSYSVDNKEWVTLSGRRWKNLNSRCNPAGSMQKSCPSYIGCTNSFVSFNDFVDWSQVQVGYKNTDWHLDKDLLVKGNKLYSKDTCLILPPDINVLLTKRKSKRGAYPLGVYWNKQNGKFKAQCNNGNGRQIYLGLFEDSTSAFYAYKTFKENLIKDMAEKWKDFIDVRAYTALINYVVEIND